jgi:hypothetical protein
MMGAPTDAELRAEMAGAGAERQAEIQAELDDRSLYRDSLRGLDPSMCDHPLRCMALR